MNKEKQIEEMARIVCFGSKQGSCEDCMRNQIIHFKECEWKTRIAERLFNEGYRKQAWISVDERTPSESGKYLVCTINGKVYQTKFYSYPENKGGHWGQKDKGKTITHWMPLPQPPKEKKNEQRETD